MTHAAEREPMSDERLEELRAMGAVRDELPGGIVHPRDAQELLAENDRLRGALQHIADGNISPSIRFARLVLDGATVKDAHRQERERMFGR
jgi:hypothetical protein